MLHQVYRREIFNVLSFDLRNRAIPSPRIAEAVTIRLLTPDDAAQFLELWRDKRAMKSKRFRQRMENGYVATGIWNEGKLIGVNWFTGNCDFDSLTGLWIKLAPRSCYALDLQEHEDFQGHRIGLATLAQSLREAKALGFDLQFICVSEYNERMLAGAKYLLGYKKVGEIKTAYWFRRPRSRWSVSGQQGRGGTLVLGG
jgi:GNAT superfamily N-acetyltransferase